MFDPQCLDLAEVFLSDHPEIDATEAVKNELAQRIQNVIDDFFEEKESDNECSPESS